MTKIKKYFANKYVIAGVVILAIIIFFVWQSGDSTVKIEYATVEVGNIVEKVSVTGKISAVDKANLAFEKSGVVTAIYRKIGDGIKKGQAIASLDGAGDAAALSAAQAQLAELTRSLRPEEYESNEAAVSTASTSLQNAKRSALTAVRDSYVKAQGAIINYADIFFNNPQSINPTINILTQSNVIERNINNKRAVVGETLQNWKNILDQDLSIENAQELLAKTEDYLSTIKIFASDLATIVSNLYPNSSGISQTTIDGYATSVNNCQSALTQAILSITNADTALQSAKAAYEQASYKFTLEKAGSSAESIAVQRAKVAQMQAELDKDKIISPIDGVVTRVEPELGEFVTAGQTMFTVQSNNAFKIEAYVPEADIAKILANNTADVTLDAYGPEVHFPAVVTMIDPAETIIEGVPTYKVTLLFTQADDRIRSGMTANTDILTREKNNVLIVPTRAISSTDGAKTARLLRANGKDFDIVNVTTGLKGSDGFLEIISGLEAGQKVVTYMK